MNNKEIVLKILEEHPNITVDGITFYAEGLINLHYKYRKRIVQQTVYKLKRSKEISSDNDLPAHYFRS